MQKILKVLVVLNIIAAALLAVKITLEIIGDCKKDYVKIDRGAA